MSVLAEREAELRILEQTLAEREAVLCEREAELVEALEAPDLLKSGPRPTISLLWLALLFLCLAVAVFAVFDHERNCSAG